MRCGLKPVAFDTDERYDWSTREERLPVIRSTLHGAAEHREECAVESLTLAVGLRAIRSRARFIDSKSRAQLGEKLRFELRSTIRVQLLRHSVARDPFCIDSAGTRRGALVSDGDGFYQPVRPSIIVKID